MNSEKMKYDWDDAKSCYEAGMFYFQNADGNRDKRTKGINLLKQACKLGSPEACFIMGKFAWEGYIDIKKPDAKNEALKLLFYAASQGEVQARVLLNEICDARYREKFEDAYTTETNSGPLTDFEGKKIKINCKGLRTPVDAVLTYENGKNVLTFRANINMISGDLEEPSEEVCNAILSGMRDWAGEYTVFGGQQLTVVVDVGKNVKLFDNLDVFFMDEGLKKAMQQIADRVGGVNGGTVGKNIDGMINAKRSFAATNKEWKIKGRKTIFIRCKGEEVTDYEKIRGIVRHEFGHVLGLGDLYYEEAKGFDGVEKGTYEELDTYHICDKIYHLVMCDKHGAISNNDIEMIVLAFSENAMQNYQPTSMNYDVSEALGKGN